MACSEPEKKAGDVGSEPVRTSWRRLRWFESVKALQDAGFDVKRDPRGIWRVQPRRDLHPDWYEAKKNGWRMDE
jgi:hypothetical protein